VLFKVIRIKNAEAKKWLTKSMQVFTGEWHLPLHLFVPF
jgi:hypothetical protein